VTTLSQLGPLAIGERDQSDGRRVHTFDANDQPWRCGTMSHSAIDGRVLSIKQQRDNVVVREESSGGMGGKKPKEVHALGNRSRVHRPGDNGRGLLLSL
jgi:hypothetical protein